MLFDFQKQECPACTEKYPVTGFKPEMQPDSRFAMFGYDFIRLIAKKTIRALREK
jgi:hypothetical protein